MGLPFVICVMGFCCFWYKTIRERTYVWVANRDKPLSNSTGTLKVSDINLVLLDQSNTTVWSTNLTGDVRAPEVAVAELLASGNLVLRESKSNRENGILWQSFDYPTDTLLPGMKLGLDLRTGRNRSLTSWKNAYDPSRGFFSCKLEIQGLPELFIWKLDAKMIRSGPWDGMGFSGLRDMERWHNINIYYSFREQKGDRLHLQSKYTSYLHLFETAIDVGWVVTTSLMESGTVEWEFSWTSWKDRCDLYAFCTPYSYCDPSRTQVCNCVKGFEPRSQLDPPECDRKTQLSCSGDGFQLLRNMKLPDTDEATVDRSVGLKECEVRCLRDCNCRAFANADVQGGGTGCVIWTGNLKDIRTFTEGGQDLYLRLAAVDLEKANNSSGKSRTTIGLSIGATILFFLSFIIFFFWRKHKQARALAAPTDTKYGRIRQNLLKTSERHFSGEDMENHELPLMEYDVIATATNDFSICNKIGEGGFGTVYKERLPDGEEIAVKRLSEVSIQGTTEFASEIQLIAKLQHINLVRLIGCYADAEEKILVYEYMENLSLDYYLFDKTRSSVITWHKRFDIIKGIARGLLYLHQDSRCRIIHRDLKASNILLDKDMIPKISDFGMARIFARDEDEATTSRVVGTYGYMSPEYIIDGTYSEI